MSDINETNPTLETQNKSVGTQDNSTKPVENNISKESYFHNFSSNADSSGVIVKPSLTGQMIPTGRTDKNGNKTFKRGPFDYRFGLYIEWDENGEAIAPQDLWTDEDKDTLIDGVKIHFDQPVRPNGEKLLDDEGREWLFWAY